MVTNSSSLLVQLMSEGKIEQLIKQKRTFLRHALKDYSAGGNDMLDDLEALLQEAKVEITHNLELVNCLKDEEGEEAWQKECLSMFKSWCEKWFGKP
jgi:hypothetical protein